MVDVFFSALVEIATLEHMSFLLAGVLIGLMVGVFPGLGGIAGLSLLMPFLYGLDTTSALAMLIGLVAVIPTSDTFASVLMGIPGSSASQATVLDGFPLAKQGEAARALSAAFFSSLVGGIIGAVILTGFVLIARPIILAFGSAELFIAVAFFGLSMVGVLAGRSLVKGLSRLRHRAGDRLHRRSAGNRRIPHGNGDRLPLRRHSARYRRPRPLRRSGNR